MLGAILGLAALCGMFCDDGNKSSNNSCNNNSYSSDRTYPVSYSRNNYDAKVRFCDAYRALDNYLASFVGESYKGITYLISGLIGYAKSHNDQEYYDAAHALQKTRDWRNYLSHDKSKWSYLENPPEWCEQFLIRFLSGVTTHYDFICELTENGKYYLYNRW